MTAGRGERYLALGERYDGYEVHDPQGEKIGKVDDVFVNENDELEYIGVKMGFMGMNTTLIPAEIVTADDEERQALEVSESKDRVKDAPNFDDSADITPEYEAEIHRHFGLETTGVRAGHYGAQKQTTETGVREDEEGLRVQRLEEELHAGTREREAGSVRVRKRVVTDHESVPVTKRREEVHVDRVPAEGEASEAEIGDDEVRVPVTEEEVVVEKRPVAKEEVRIRKEVVEDEKVVEEDVRREEVDVEGDTERRDG